MAFESGVSGYLKTQAIIKVNFPISLRGNIEMSCIHCPYLASNERTCQLNKKPIAYPQKYVGDGCPLEMIEVEEGKNND